MKLEAGLVCTLLRESYETVAYGADLKGTGLMLPTFYAASVRPEAGHIYLTRAEELPVSCGEKCLFLCLGNRPDERMKHWQCGVLYFPDKSLDMLTLANFVTGLFQRISDWREELERLLARNAQMEEYVLASIPIFDNCITITDYNLRMLASCKAVMAEGRRRIVIDRTLDHIPSDVSGSISEIFLRNVGQHEPFFYKGQRDDPEGLNYCINLHLGDCYVGSCTLWEQGRKFRESDYILFGEFAACIRSALRSRSASNDRNLLTLRSVFSDLLQCFPVSRSDVDTATEWIQQNLNLGGLRYCIVIRSANDGKALPMDYICTTLEDFLPYSYAFAHGDRLVCFSMLPDEMELEEEICHPIRTYLKDMNFRAGISEGFTDIFDARAYYLQARAALETGFRISPVQYIYRFQDYILAYMLDHSLGEFEPEMVLVGGLRALMDSEDGRNLETLRLYLDNECNAAKTAQDLHLHRSSLMPRLEKIREQVDMETPEQRLYLRMCLSRIARIK